MPSGHGSDEPTVLLVSSNGAGMGHLARLLAYQRRLPAGVRTHVVSLSQAAPVVSAFGVPWEYIPSAAATGLRGRDWRSLFAERMSEVVQRVRPAVVVFDGTHPYAGLDLAVASVPGTRAVWSRRGMWKRGLSKHHLAKGAWFDVVLEPGDLAGAADTGATVGTEAARVRPVTLLDPEDLSERAEAREALGLPAEGPLALVSLGAGNLNDTRDEVRAAADALTAHGLGVCVTQPDIAERAHRHEHVHVVRHFPLSQHLAAFDVAVAAAGYNSFHEHLRLGLPTVFVPNRQTSLDDQAARAQFAADHGWALTTPTLTGGAAHRVVDELIEHGQLLAARARAADPGNGSGDAAAIIAELATGGSP